MELQVTLPNTGPAVDLARLVEIATAAEECGFTTVWVSDHVLPPRHLAAGLREVLEPIVLLTYLAARLRRVRLGTCVLVVPMRNPFNVAKQAATLDLVSEGRLVLGVGAGYMEDEFTNVHADFRTRGERLDEAIRLLRHLFSGETSAFVGKHYGYEDGVFGPIPPQGARLPIMVGGHSRAAVKRAATLGDIWQASGILPERFAEQLRMLRAIARTRDLRVGAGIGVTTGATSRWDTPSAHELIETMAEWEAAGAEYLNINFGAAEGCVERMREFTAARATYRPKAIGRALPPTASHAVIAVPHHDRGNVMVGNMAPAGAVHRVAQGGRRWLRGRAKVYDGEAAAIEAVRRGEIRSGMVIVIRSDEAGREMSTVIDDVVRNGSIRSIAVVTDGKLGSAPGGLLVESVSPPARAGGPLSAVRDGDLICIDVNAGRIDVEYADLARR